MASTLMQRLRRGTGDTVVPAGDGQAPPPEAPLTPRQRLVRAIVEECAAKHYEVDETTAEAYINYTELVRDQLGGRSGHVFVPNEVLAMHHDTMQSIMPDDVRAEPGSAHELLNQHLYPDGDREIVHSWREVNNVRYCSVRALVVRRSRAARR